MGHTWVGRLNVLDSVFGTNEDSLIANQQYKADISEVDLAEALTEIKRQEFALQAASQTFSKVNATTLFDFILIRCRLKSLHLTN
ncbi:hypothetical protein [Alishewanella longhuensis]